jgi:predicted nuclease of restriction endonuclease-like (RecB) superfamily
MNHSKRGVAGMSEEAVVRLVNYEALLSQVSGRLDQARRTSARSVNAIMTVTYWLVGRDVVQYEQAGAVRAEYGEVLLKTLALDLTARFGRGYGWRNIFQMRAFYLAYSQILQTPSAISGNGPTMSSRSEFEFHSSAPHFSLPWSAYVRLLSVKDERARQFYEEEALRGGWSVRQLDRQIGTLYYERTALSRNKAKMLAKGGVAKPEDIVTPEEEVKDPYVLEFLGLKDEYSEAEIEEALILHLERFLLELGGDFAFVGRQKRLRIGDEWYRVDLLFFHRRLKCLVVIDLKAGKFTHADAGQMHMYLNYAREHWTHADENPPVGLILCAQKDDAVAKYALEGLPNKVIAAQYQTALPDPRLLEDEMRQTRRIVEGNLRERRAAYGVKRDGA